MHARPNILIILADDMGFSDIGCFGSEIHTPNLDALAADGLRMTAFTNAARCCPSRASLLTGYYPHQVGIGGMTRPCALDAYQGYLRADRPTTAELLQAAGYHTWCSGKWHVGGDYAVHQRQQWQDAGDATHPLPTQRGFTRYYGTLGGAGSYFQPPTLLDQEHFIDDFPEDYHLTDALSQRACDFIDEAAAAEKPFYGYLAYTAPHWPLHAWEEDIAAYRGCYREGWDVLRQRRFAALRAAGLLDHSWDLSPRDEDSHPWDSTAHPQWEAERMAVYAAMVSHMDRGIGQVMQRLKDQGLYDDTLIIFMSDNGGCAEFLREDGEAGRWPEFYNLPTNRGTLCTVGNNPHRQPGPAETFMSYDLPWANASNTPFRKFKVWTHEGGISTPFVARWKNGGINGNRLSHAFAHINDLAATIHAASGVAHPGDHGDLPPLPGRDLLPLWRGQRASIWDDSPVFWEHEDHAAVRHGRWKLVRARADEAWQLHDMQRDRTELHDLAAEHPAVVNSLASAWQDWADQVGVRPRAEVVAHFT
ncbi:MAG: arylsulfatase [Planctomycetota bacterium]|nr:MAG: arylsulfatase [Planctomycetota bacterium]